LLVKSWTPLVHTMSIVTPIKLTIYNLFEKKNLVVMLFSFWFFLIKIPCDKLQHLYLCKEIAEKVFGEKIHQIVAKIVKNRKIGNPIVLLINFLGVFSGNKHSLCHFSTNIIQGCWVNQLYRSNLNPVCNYVFHVLRNFHE
jgi:hypothetical protein